MFAKFESVAALAALAAIFADTAEAFWGKGHLLVARQAESVLADTQPQILELALKELDQLTQSHPDMIVHEKDHSFTECATFADDIKETFGNWQTPWHFIDQPYLDEPGTTVDDFPDFKMDSVDVVSALTDLTAFLKDETDIKHSHYVRKIAEYFPKHADQRSFALRMIIHYVGDIHQPLHAVSEVDSRFPTGDFGGNAQKVPDIQPGSGVGDLHAIWDSVIYGYTGYTTQPLDVLRWKYYTDNANKIMSEHEIDETKIHAQDFHAWAQESLDIATSTVYQGFEPDQAPTQEYMDNAQGILETRMHYGGQRLALLVTDIYSKPEEDLFLQD